MVFLLLLFAIHLAVSLLLVCLLLHISIRNKSPSTPRKELLIFFKSRHFLYLGYLICFSIWQSILLNCLYPSHCFLSSKFFRPFRAPTSEYKSNMLIETESFWYLKISNKSLFKILKTLAYYIHALHTISIKM